jgi:hypothetical protein
MITDALLNFLGLGANQSMVGAAGTSIQIGNVIDLLGLGVGVPPTNVNIGNVTNYGAADAMGVGANRPELNISVGTAFVTANAATLEVVLQAAADSGTPTYQPGAWNDLGTSGLITAANLTANQVIARLPWLPPFPPGLRPRFLRLLGRIPSATNFTAGTIASALVTLVRDDQFNKYAAKNFTVS